MTAGAVKILNHRKTFSMRKEYEISATYLEQAALQPERDNDIVLDDDCHGLCLRLRWSSFEDPDHRYIRFSGARITARRSIGTIEEDIRIGVTNLLINITESDDGHLSGSNCLYPGVGIELDAFERGNLDITKDSHLRIEAKICTEHFPSTPQTSKLKIYNLVSANIDSIRFNNIGFVLYKRSPLHVRDYSSIGVVYANKALLINVAPYFASYESFSEGCTNLSEMPESELIDPEGDSDMEDNVEDASVDPPMSQEVLGVNDPLYHDKGRESMSRRGTGTSTFMQLTTILDTNCRNQLQYVAIPDCAYKTWRAFIFWVYTNQINFASLKTINYSNHDITYPLLEMSNSDLPSPVSCKSVYRLAEKYHVKELAALALQHYESQIKDSVFIQELTTFFASTYPEVQNLLSQHLKAHLSSHRSQLREVLSQLSDADKMRTYWIVEALLS